MERLKDKQKRRAHLRRSPRVPNKARTRWFEESWFRAIEAIGIVLAIAAILFEIHQRITVDRPVANATLKEIQSAQIARAWDATGNRNLSIRSRTEALNLLVTQGQDIEGMDFSCKAITGDFEGPERCYGKFTVDGLTLTGNNEKPHKFVDFSGIRMENLQAKNAAFVRSNFSNAEIRNSDFSGASLTKIDMQNASLTDVSFLDTQMTEVDVTGAFMTFQNLLLKDQGKFLSGAYFIKGNPPRLSQYERNYSLDDGPLYEKMPAIDEYRERALIAGAVECPDTITGFGDSNNSCLFRWFSD